MGKHCRIIAKALKKKISGVYNVDRTYSFCSSVESMRARVEMGVEAEVQGTLKTMIKRERR